MKNKLFIPRKISGEDSRWSEWNNLQKVIDGKRINQYDSEGRKQGVWYDYYNEKEQIHIYEKSEYKNDKQIGIWEQYHYSGELSEKNIYSNTGRKIGKWTSFDTKGYLTKTIEFKNNSKIQVITYHNGSNNIKSIINYKGDMRNGLLTIFHENGKPKEKRFYVKDKIDKWSSQYSKTGGLLRIIENSSPKDRIEYFLSKNAIGNKKVYWRLITIREEKISQEDIINIINQAKSEALFQI
jgi:antitoxin component YwqK of YwqJK toxin-antitoxin module